MVCAYLLGIACTDNYLDPNERATVDAYIEGTVQARGVRDWTVTPKPSATVDATAELYEFCESALYAFDALDSLIPKWNAWNEQYSYLENWPASVRSEFAAAVNEASLAVVLGLPPTGNADAQRLYDIVVESRVASRAMATALRTLDLDALNVNRDTLNGLKTEFLSYYFAVC